VRLPRAGIGTALLFAVAYVLVALVGHATAASSEGLAMVWPAAGVAVLWLLVRDAPPWSLDTALLLLGAVLVDVLTGMTMRSSGALIVSNVLQAVVIAELIRRYVPELWGGGGARAIDSPRLLGRYLACVGTGVGAATVVGITWWLLAGNEATLVDLFSWAGRNVCGVLVVTTAGLLVLQYLAQQPPRARLWQGSRLEFVAACLVTAGLYALVFLGDAATVMFLIPGVVIWFGVRFGSLTTSLHTVVVALIVVPCTLAMLGPFASNDVERSTLLVQLYLAATACTGLALSTGLEERAALTEVLRQTSAEMGYQAGLLNAVVNSMSEGLAVVDEDGRWLLRNPAATRVGGLAGDLRSLLAEAAGDADPLARALAGETVPDTELRVATGPAQGRILAVSASPLPPDSEGGRARALLIFRDATTEHARRVDLTAFADVVAHDLRNPLAAVESWTEMMATELGDDVDVDLVRQYVDRVGHGTRRMTDLIEELLDRATSDSALRLRRVSVAELAVSVAAERGVSDRVRVTAIPEALADPALVRQVLDNLIGNALKFVSEGAVPEIRVSGGRTGSGTVAVRVEDRGIGLPPGSPDQLFEERFRGHSTYDGRGLGLAICRRIVERHGGTITARDNQPGPGATFEFTLPAAD